MIRVETTTLILNDHLYLAAVKGKDQLCRGDTGVLVDVGQGLLDDAQHLGFCLRGQGTARQFVGPTHVGFQAVVFVQLA